MLRKLSMVIFALSSTYSIIRALTNWKHLFKSVSYTGGVGSLSVDYLHYFFIGLAVASLVGIFIFKEDSKSDSQPK